MKLGRGEFGTRDWVMCTVAALIAIGAQISPAAPGDYIVVLKAGAQPAAVAKSHGVNRRHTYAHALNGFSGHIPEGRLTALKKDPRVAFVEPDLEVFALAQTIPTGVKRISALMAPAAKIDGTDERVDVDVAILDTGIDLTHPDLFVYRSVSFTTNDTTGDDLHGHGSHVAGIVGALDNRSGVVGVAPGVRLWAVKVLNDTGSGSLSSVLNGVDYVTANAGEIEVANVSLGGLGYVESLRIAIRNSIAKGVVYVVAAGNSTYEIYGADHLLGTADDFYPASYPEVMTVSAMVDSDGQAGGTGPTTTRGADDTLAIFSNYSNNVVPDNPIESPGAAIDIAAPGVNIFSTHKDGGYATMSGTSMAAPHVAGAVALYISQHGRAFDAAGVYRIRQALVDGAEPQSSWGRNPTNPNPFKDFQPEGLLNVTGMNGRPLPYDPSAPVNRWPTVSINNPASGTTFSGGTTVIFSAAASDPEDGNLAANVIWISSINGQIGTGATCSASLSNGTHTITARVADSAGAPASAAVTVHVISTNDRPPTISVISPAPNSTFVYGTAIPFTATALDPEDGDIRSTVRWSSSINGYLTTGSTFMAPLSLGTHTITADVTDSSGSLARETITVTVSTTVPATPFRITSIVRTNGKAIVRWEGGTGPYQLQIRNELNGGWQSVGGPVSGTSATNTLTGERAFFRVQAAGN